MIEKDRSLFGKEQRFILTLGDEFSPFENGFTDIPDLDLPLASDAFGYSPTFKIRGIGIGRIELFHDMKHLVPIEEVPQADQYKYRGHKLIPTIAVPTIYYNDPESAETNLFCLMEYRDTYYYGENDLRYNPSDYAVFTQWKSEEDPGGLFDFMTLDDLKQMKVMFNLIEDNDSDYLMSNDGFNGDGI